MYVLKTNFRGRGFRLIKNRQQIFKTTIYDGDLYSSSVVIHGDNYEIKQNQDKLNIYKNDAKIGLLDLFRKPYSIITLQRTDGTKDFFKLESTNMSHYTLYSAEEDALVIFNQAWSKMFFFNEFKVKLLSDAYSDEILEELIYYAGEAIYLKTWKNEVPEEPSDATRYNFSNFLNDLGSDPFIGFISPL